MRLAAIFQLKEQRGGREMLSRFINDESAATAIEYALIAALISLAVVAGASNITEVLHDNYQNTATKLQESIEP